jgi:pyruvate/2-oxoglutarate dehydrogenase complex dihydrolipoamide acyltransferase (E2) component
MHSVKHAFVLEDRAMSGARVVMPQLGESIVEATIVKWRVRVGEPVTRGQTLAEVETDKATSEIPAPRAGVVKELLFAEGTTVPVGTAILGLDDGTESPRPAPPPSSRLPTQHLAPRPIDARGGPIRSSPAVRRLARRFNLDIMHIEGTGKGGRVTRDDVLRAGVSRPSAPPPIARAEATPFITQIPSPASEIEFRPATYRVQDGDQVVPFSRRRTQIAGHMSYSLHTAAHVVAIAEIDMSRVMAAKRADEKIADKQGLKLTFMPYVIERIARALGEHPEINATVVGQSLVLRREKNIGVAVDTEEGLIVPVIKRADELGLLGITRALQELSDRARRGQLSPEDLSGGSFTISNPGRDGNLFGVSIIRQPEVAIIRLGSIVKRAVVREIEGEDVIVVRPMMYAALSYDHRVIDGRKGNAFLHRVSELLSRAEPEL